MNTAVAATETTVTAPARKAGRPVNPNSKLVQAKALYNSLVVTGAGRKAILAALQSELGLKEGSAAVYYHEAKNDANAAKAPVAVAPEKTTEGSAENGQGDGVSALADESQTG